MTLKHNIKIVKVPLPSSEKNINRPQVFPRMPRLYLELLENKSKIKQDLINKEYSPKKSITNKDGNLESKLDKFLNDEKNVIEEKNNDVKEEDENFQEDEHIDYKEKKRKERKDKKNKYKDQESDQESNQENEKDDSKIKDQEIEIEIENKDNETVSINSKKSEEDNKDENESDYENKTDKYDNDDTDSDMESKASSVDNLSVRLNNLLNDKNDDNNSVRTDKSKNKYSRRRDYEENVSVSTKQNRTKNINIAPSLAELESQGGYVRKQTLRDINNIPYNDQEEEDLKREIMFKIELLKKSYPNSSIPEFSIHSDYKSMKKTYDDTVRRLSLDSTVESYKTYLIGGFMACEFVLGNFFKLEMTGFTQQQILSMNNYEKLLIELGEKSYVPTGSKWPVEIRLLFMIIMNAGFFVVSKMIMKKTGANLLGMINGMNVQTQSQQTKKRKMKGPEIDINDIPEE